MSCQPAQLQGLAGLRANEQAMGDDERQARLAGAAALYERAAIELERAAAHATRAAEHFLAGEVPRGTAHAWASFGHLKAAEDELLQQARDHRERSSV
jgi:hypothetical protein